VVDARSLLVVDVLRVAGGRELVSYYVCLLLLAMID
jgi:hypothetical protein